MYASWCRDMAFGGSGGGSGGGVVGGEDHRSALDSPHKGIVMRAFDAFFVV